MSLNIVLWVVCSFVLLQAVVITFLVTVDLLRKRRRAPTSFPWISLEPVDVEGNHFRVFTYGEELYAAMLAAIDAAQQRVMFETFIWKDDAVGNDFKRRLIAASERGVEVYVIYDGFANLVVPRAFKRFPRSLHVLRHPAIPRLWRIFDPRRYGRNHRKVLVVDGKVGFIGGFNIGARYATEWRDTHLSIEGRVVADLENAFVDFWNGHRTRRLPALEDLLTRPWEPTVRVHRNDPVALVFPIRSMYLEAIDRASSHIHLTHAYFIPDRPLLRSLLQAAERGVDVCILLPARSNHIVADWLARGFYGRCLRGGVRLLLYQNAMIHAKTAQIDGVWSTIGTANMDRLSLAGNYEINVEVYAEALAAQMEKIFAQDSTNVRELTLAEWNARPWFAKIGETILLPLRPLL
jgi:cardiolipin synthase A/B